MNRDTFDGSEPQDDSPMELIEWEPVSTAELRRMAAQAAAARRTGREQCLDFD